MNEQVSPVTEPEVRTFFSRLSTMIVNASEQSAVIKRLGDDMEYLRTTLDEVRQENNKLKTEIADTWQLVANLEKERDVARSEAERAKVDLLDQSNRHVDDLRERDDRLAHAHDALAQRDQRIAELEQELGYARSAEQAAKTRSEALERDIEGHRRDVEWWRMRYQHTEQALREATDHARQLSEANTSLASKLEGVQTRLGEAIALFSPAVPQIEGPKPTVIEAHEEGPF